MTEARDPCQEGAENLVEEVQEIARFPVKALFKKQAEMGEEKDQAYPQVFLLLFVKDTRHIYFEIKDTYKTNFVKVNTIFNEDRKSKRGLSFSF